LTSVDRTAPYSFYCAVGFRKLCKVCLRGYITHLIEYRKQSFNKKAVLLTAAEKSIEMNVKIDTKEKFHVINILETELTANMTEDLKNLLGGCRQNEVKNIVLNLKGVKSMDAGLASSLLSEQEYSYESNQSFVICCLEKELEAWLDKAEILEIMNVTPTESEAWDIIQMEEIERELMD
jgi:anti-anti-sigma factor